MSAELLKNEVIPALDAALRALTRQEGQPTRPCLWDSSAAFLKRDAACESTILKDSVAPQSLLDSLNEAQTDQPLHLLSVDAVATLLRGLPRLHGGEHEVWFCHDLNLAVKVTNVGEFGAEKLGLRGYARRLAWSNEFFNLLGRVRLPNEDGERVLTTQPWYRADGFSPESPHPSQKEIDVYMRKKGFLKAYDGAYLHDARDVVASDALPKNFIRDAAGRVQAVDIILVEPSARQPERLMAMVANQTQVTL